MHWNPNHILKMHWNLNHIFLCFKCKRQEMFGLLECLGESILEKQVLFWYNFFCLENQYQLHWQHHCFADNNCTWTSHTRKHCPAQMQVGDQQTEITFYLGILAGVFRLGRAEMDPVEIPACFCQNSVRITLGFTGYSSFPRLGKKMHFLLSFCTSYDQFCASSLSCKITFSHSLRVEGKEDAPLKQKDHSFLIV